MPSEIGLWRIDGSATPVPVVAIEKESLLEDLLHQDVSVLGLDALVIGRQVATAHGGKIDLLALDAEGAVHVLELKRDKTPREVVAQLLDYASWIQGLSFDDLSLIYAKKVGGDLEAALLDKFGAPPPRELHHLLYIVASVPDPSTERIVEYLTPFGVPINGLFFRSFVDGDHRYLARTWLMEPRRVRAAKGPGGVVDWDGTSYYVAIKEEPERAWEDLKTYGFVSAGGGPKYADQLLRLNLGDTVHAFSPGHGYVGVGTVAGARVLATDLIVETGDGPKPLREAPITASMMWSHAEDPHLAEYVVPVEWLATVPLKNAIWQSNLFSNMLVVCALRSQATIRYVRDRLHLDEPGED